MSHLCCSAEYMVARRIYVQEGSIASDSSGNLHLTYTADNRDVKVLYFCKSLVLVPVHMREDQDDRSDSAIRQGHSQVQLRWPDLPVWWPEFHIRYFACHFGSAQRFWREESTRSLSRPSSMLNALLEAFGSFLHYPCIGLSTVRPKPCAGSP